MLCLGRSWTCLSISPTSRCVRRKHSQQCNPDFSRAGISLHAKQVQLLRRGLHLLKPGGRLSYSTCSLNPLENEACYLSERAYMHTYKTVCMVVPMMQCVRP
eukprot:1910858-Amphidinium_carterae.1